jgi:hypothetical protein
VCVDLDQDHLPNIACAKHAAHAKRRPGLTWLKDAVHARGEHIKVLDECIAPQSSKLRRP